MLPDYLKKGMFLKILFGVSFLLLGIGIFYIYNGQSRIPASPLYVNSELSIDNRVSNLISYMTLEEKIGQMALGE